MIWYNGWLVFYIDILLSKKTQKPTGNALINVPEKTKNIWLTYCPILSQYELSTIKRKPSNRSMENYVVLNSRNVLNSI